LLVSLVPGWRSDRSAGPGPLRATGLGFVAGMVYFTGTVYWTSSVMRQFGDLATPLAFLLMLLLAAYMSLYPAIFALILQRLLGRFGAQALLLAPAIWVTTELGRAHLFTGFPWVLLGYSQAIVLPVAQLASLFGVYGLSALVALVNAALAFLATDRRRIRWGPVAVAAAVLVVSVGWGTARLRYSSLTRQGEPMPVALIQGNIPQEQKWDPAHAPAILRRYVEMSEATVAGGARFIVWPESSLPFYFQEDPVGGDVVRSLAHRTRAHILVGSDQIERGKPPRYFNAAFLITPDGTVGGIYRKMHLVPFGE